MTMQIAKTILQQLGGSRFIAMTGAKKFGALENGLQFDLPSTAHFVKGGINRIQIHLDPTDTYTMMTFKKRGMDCHLVQDIPGLYWDMLQPTFTEVTGLDTHL